MRKNLVMNGGFPTGEGLDITWTITTKCNFNCHYCLVKKGSDTRQTLINKLIKEINLFTGKVRYVVLFGGEPTLHPYLLKIIKLINFPTKVWSNLTADTDLYKKILSLGTRLVCTYHRDLFEINDFIHKLQSLQSYKQHIDCHIPLSKNFDNYDVVYDKISPLVNKCETIPIVGIPFYYKKGFLYKNTCQYETNITVTDVETNESRLYTKDDYFELEKYNPHIVSCDRNKYNIDITCDGKYVVCNKVFPSLEEATAANVICRNTKCNVCFYYIGRKKGIFDVC